MAAPAVSSSTSSSSSIPTANADPDGDGGGGGDYDEEDEDEGGGDEDGKYEDETSGSSQAKGKRGRPRKHAPKIPLPPLYVFIREATIQQFIRDVEHIFYGHTITILSGFVVYLARDRREERN
jgi:hypothetical protein